MQAGVKKIKGGQDLHYNIFLGQLLGKGTFANVYKGAVEGKPNQKVAVKMISKKNLEKFGEKGTNNLQNELSILSKIKHTNIVKLEDWSSSTSNYYFVFEFCSGGDLQGFIKNNGALDELSA